jgi:nicotinate-nucleotide--dimethylbenzimidazole phosphoribosyltransferase
MLSQFEIAAPDPKLAAQVQAEIDRKTKPLGSLGRIEKLALQLACAQRSMKPVADPARLLLFAGDHGMVAEGVSAWPSEVTTLMVANFLAGGAAANVFARANGIDITIIDAGIAGEMKDDPALLRAGIRRGTRNAVREDALTPAEVQAALEYGARLAADAAESGTRVIALGEMGIGNTSSATLLAHKITGTAIARLAGPGAGLDDAGLARKTAILELAAARREARLSPEDALAAYGGLEIACMAGALVGAASKGAVVLVDGFIATAAALCALTARPEAMAHAVFAHRSKEPGHRLVLEAMRADPLIDLDLRLGEGTGALLAHPLLRAASAMLRDMATFESAGIAEKDA